MKKPDLSKLPHEPGCYLYKDSRGTIIYIGKAKDLKNRVSSYFNKIHEIERTNVLVKNIVDFDFIVTSNEVEALLLENNLIKKYNPKYNIDLRDSKRYAFIEKTYEKFPRFRVARTNKVKGKIFGPFVSAKMRDDVLDTINRTFKLRTCNHLPKRGCLRYSIGLCSAPCVGKIEEDEYLGAIKSAEMVLKGKVNDLLSIVDKKMKKASKDDNFEKAIEYRDIKESLLRLNDKQKVERQKKFDEDVVNYEVRDGIVYLLVFNIYKGTLHDKQEFVFDYYDGFFEDFLSRFYSEQKIPKKIVLSESVSDSLIGYLCKVANKRIEVTVPQKGDLKQLMKLVKKNIEISFFYDLGRLEELQKGLKLSSLPYVIECFDISHLSGTSIVASMVQFRNGKSDKSNYRRFKLKTVFDNDDFASMREVVRRRYSKLKKDGEAFPDLIVVDGGLGQLNSALGVLEELGVKIPIVSLAKRLEEVYVPGKDETIKLNRKNKGRLLLQAIRDEAHRFAIGYNRLLRKKSLFN